MSKRRSLDDALSPAESEFVKSPDAEKVVQQGSSQQSDEEDDSRSTSEQNSELNVAAGKGLVSLNTRIPPELDTELLRISLERRIAGIKPATKQDIVTEALRTWLSAAKNSDIS